MKFYVTFGWGHKHPATGEEMRDYWVEMEANSLGDAMDAAEEIFGQKWSLCYEENRFDKSFHPKGDYYERERIRLTIDELFERKVKGIL